MGYFIKFFILIPLSVVALSTAAQDKTGTNGLSMKGWNLETAPKVGNPNQETGTISYEIEIDSVGNLLTVTVLKNEISDELAKKCEAEIRKMNFTKNATNIAGIATTKGTITFVFKVH